jgi:hypothetical protein
MLCANSCKRKVEKNNKRKFKNIRKKICKEIKNQAKSGFSEYETSIIIERIVIGDNIDYFKKRGFEIIVEKQSTKIFW